MWKDCTAAEAPFSVFCAQHWAQAKWEFKADFETTVLPSLSSKAEGLCTDLGTRAKRKFTSQEAEIVAIALDWARAQNNTVLVNKLEAVTDAKVTFNILRDRKKKPNPNPLTPTEVGKLFPGRQAATKSVLDTCNEASQHAIDHLDAFLAAVQAEETVTDKTKRLATRMLVAGFGVQQTAEAVATFKLMKVVLEYWKTTPKAVFEDTWAGRFGWVASTTPPDGVFTLPSFTCWFGKYSSVCFPSSVAGEDPAKLSFKVLHEAAHGTNKKVIDHAYMSQNYVDFITLSPSLRLENADHYCTVVEAWNAKKAGPTPPTDKYLVECFGDPDQWNPGAIAPNAGLAALVPVKPAVLGAGAAGAQIPEARMVGEVSTIAQQALIWTQNALKILTTKFASGNVFSTPKVGDQLKKTVELLKLHAAKGASVASEPLTPDDVAKFSLFEQQLVRFTKSFGQLMDNNAYNTELRADAVVKTNGSKNIKVEAGSPKKITFPKDWKTVGGEPLVRGWLIQVLLEHAGVRFDSGLTPEALAGMYKEYWVTQQNQPTLALAITFN
jgi:hypothetical protein